MKCHLRNYLLQWKIANVSTKKKKSAIQVWSTIFPYYIRCLNTGEKEENLSNLCCPLELERQGSQLSYWWPHKGEKTEKKGLGGGEGQAFTGAAQTKYYRSTEATTYPHGSAAPWPWPRKASTSCKKMEALHCIVRKVNIWIENERPGHFPKPSEDKNHLPSST